MRRALVLLFTFLLPLQFAWGAVTAYCQHETGMASHHFGHHEHVHHSDHLKKAGTGSDQDNDCGTCHATGLPALTGGLEPVLLVAPRQAPFLAAGPRPPAAPGPEPERPKWARLA